MKIVCERRTDEGLRTFKNDAVGTIHTIDAGDKRVIERIPIKQATKKGYIECEVGGVANLSYPNSKTRRGRVLSNGQISPTITATETEVSKIEMKNDQYRIRKLTPRECWRLMDFTDADFDKAKWYSKEEVNALLKKYPKHKGKRQFTEEERIERMSDTQLYKQAGNSICVGVLYYIFKELYKAMPYLFDDLKVSSYFSGIGAFENALDRLYKEINSDFITSPHGVQ